MTKKFPVYFDRFTLELTQEQAESGAHPGKCDDDIAELLKLPEIAAQIDALSPQDISAELKGFGAWDETELQDHDANRGRLLWIACGQLNEGAAPEDEEPESVSLIVSSYDWECPACDTWNTIQENPETVTCGECGKTYPVDAAVHIGK